MLNRLQILQNTAARIITKTPRYEHITPVLKELHWLPKDQRVEFKILLYTFKALNDQTPSYLKELVEIYVPARNLRSMNNAKQLVVQQSRTVKYGDGSFSSVASKLWNALPATVRDSRTVNVFIKSLKTHIFHKVYEN